MSIEALGQAFGHVWVILLLFSMLVVIMLLSWLLLRREKAIQLMAFSLSATGMKLSFELNKDEKLKNLALENITLQKELQILRETIKKQSWTSIVMLILFICLLAIVRLGSKFKTTFTKAEPDKVESNDTKAIE